MNSPALATQTHITTADTTAAHLPSIADAEALRVTAQQVVHSAMLLEMALQTLADNGEPDPEQLRAVHACAQQNLEQIQNLFDQINQ